MSGRAMVARVWSPDPKTGPGPRSRALAARLRAVETEDVTFLSDDFPIFWERAEGASVYDVDGQRYLDMTAAFGVASLGHGAPSVRAAIEAQAGALIHGMGDVHPPAGKVPLLEALAGVVPVDDPRVTLASSGSMATEIALKAVALATGRHRVLAFEGGYHGLTAGALRVAGIPWFREPFLGGAGALVPHPLATLPYPEALDESAGAPAVATSERCLEAVDEALRGGAEEVGAVIIEPIQGRGGVRVPPPGFLSALADMCRSRDVLLVVDEIFTGFCRTGPLFACADEGVRPDLLLLGKALGGGMPLGACVGRAPIMASFGASRGEALHTETFLGHPLVSAAALAALQALTDPALPASVLDRGRQVETILRERFGRWRTTGVEVRGRGLMWGVMLRDPAGRPDRQAASAIVRAALQRGLILLGGGVDGGVVQFTPPFSLDEADLVALDARLARTLEVVD